MSGAEWITEKINSLEGTTFKAVVESSNAVFVEREEKSSAYIGVVPTRRNDSAPLVKLSTVQEVHAENNNITMIIAIPREARWSGAAMSWLQDQGIAFGGVGDLLSALSYDDDLSTYRNKTIMFVDNGLRRHSRVLELEWVESRKLEVKLKNDAVITVALDDSYDITMGVARDAARVLGEFDILLKTNPNGSITSNGREDVEHLGFRTYTWGQLLGYLAKQGGQASNDYLRERLRRARSAN